MTTRRDAFESTMADARAEFRGRGRLLRSAVREEARTFWLRHRLEIAAVCALAAMSGMACRLLSKPDRPVTAFVYTYPFGTSAGLRAWHLDGFGRWHERDPDGHEARLFDATTRTSVDGCRGSATRASGEPGFTFFIPDAGCRTMALMLKRGDAPWSALGTMSIVSTGPARDE